MFFSKDYWEKEWAALEKREMRFLERQQEEKASKVTQKIAEKVPEKLERTLKAAFNKAFEVVFEKGTGLIEKTYDKERQKQSFQVNEYTARILKNRKSV